MVNIDSLKEGDVLISLNGRTFGPVTLINYEAKLIGLKTREGTRPFKPEEVDYLGRYLKKKEDGSQPRANQEWLWKGFALSLLRKSANLCLAEQEILGDLEKLGLREVKGQELLEKI